MQPRNKDIQFFLSNEHNFNKLFAACWKTRRERRGKVVSGGQNLACDHIPGPKAATVTNVPPCAGEDIRVRDIHAGIKETAELCTR